MKRPRERDPRSVLSLPLLPAKRPDEVPHWKCWAFTLRTGIPWWKK